MSEVANRWKDPGVLFVEPSAGTGAFIKPLKNAGRKVKAIDIDPQAPGILRRDFLEITNIFSGNHSKIVVIGNPPFGKNACIAVRFFNRAADFADEIAFIVPRTFRKRSIQNLRLGEPHHVPCAWQVWNRRTVERTMPSPPSVDHLIDYTTPRFADFAMRRVGFYAGRVHTKNLRSLSQTTHYFLREKVCGVIEALRQVKWTDVASQTAGVRSLSKAEIAFKLSKVCHV